MTTGGLLYAGTAVASGVLGVTGLVAWTRQDVRWARPLWRWSAPLLFALASAAWAHRWYVAGHLPIFGTYESALSLAVAILGAASIYGARGALSTSVGPVAAVVTAALLAHGSGFDATVYALTISERSLVVDVHAVFAWLALGVFVSNLGISVATLVRRRERGRHDAWIVSTLKLGFALHTGMMVSGSFYKFLLFGKAWSFDPMELLGFVAWVAYGTLLHLSMMAGWRGRKLAGWCVFVFVLLLVSYRAIVYFPAWSTYHILDVDLRMHVPG